MRNGLLLWFCSLFYLSSVSADKRSLPKFEITERKILTFHLEPQFPKVGQKLSLFLQSNTGITKNEIVAEAFLDESSLKLTSTGQQLWAVTMKPFSEVKAHELKVNIFVRDSKEAGRLKSAINQLKKEIAELNVLIEAEIEPSKKAALEALRDQKQAYSDDLELNLDGIKSYVKTESFDFSVAGDALNPAYPLVTSASPNAAPLGKRIRVVLIGENFPENPNVKFGGQNATIISAGATTIEVLAPNFSLAGLKTIEITFPATEDKPRKNAVLSNSFYAADRAVLKNLRPVAVTTGYHRVVWPPSSSVVLQGDNSYDENGDNFAYEWTFQKSPPGSVFTTGSALANAPTPSFTPDKIGIYTIKLRLIETTTEELLNSFVSTVTVEVK